MANNVIGSLLINLGLETARLKSDTDKAAQHFNGFEQKAQRALKGVGRGVSSVMSSMTAMTGVAGVLSVSGLGVLVKSSIDTADQIGKLSTRIGASTEALSEYKHVAELSGVSFNTLTMGWQRMTRRVAEAAQGTGEAKNALIELNLSAKDLNQLAPEQQFETIADALNGVGNQADRVRLAMKLFDSEGVSLLQTMGEGAAGMREMRMEARELGLTISGKDALGAATANDALTRLKGSTTGLSLALAKSLGPAIADVANWLRVEIPSSVNAAQSAMDHMGQRIHSIWETFFENDQISQPIDEARAKLKLLEQQLAGSAPGSGNATIIQQQIDQQKELVARLQATDDQLAKHRDAWNQTYGVLEEGQNKNFQSNAEFGLGLGGGSSVGGADDPEAEAQAKELQKLQDRLAARLEAVDISLMSEEQRLFDSYANRQLIVEDAFENELISQERRQELILQLEEQFEEQRTAIAEKGLTDRQKFERMTTMNKVKFQLGAMTQMTQGVASNNRKLFELNKALALADAAVTLPDAVLKTYNNNGGYPWGIIPAALMAAVGLAQIQQIQSASFGGGGAGAASLAGSGGTPSNPVPQDSGQFGDNNSNRSGGVTEVHVHGAVMDKDGFREALVEGLETARDNDEIRLTG